jgi:hypothetical protein
MKTVAINVTQNDINKGVKKSCNLCPIARAIKRILKKKHGVNVYPHYAEIIINGTEKRIKFSAAPRDFIRNFDQENVVKPFEFEIAMVDQS